MRNAHAKRKRRQLAWTEKQKRCTVTQNKRVNYIIQYISSNGQAKKMFFFTLSFIAFPLLYLEFTIILKVWKVL